MTQNQRFRLTEEHLKLLKEAYVEHFDHCEWGYVSLDCKRPFGNNDLVSDMAKILGILPVETDDEETHWPPGTAKRMVHIFETELPKAIEIVLTTQSFEPGVYEADNYDKNWSKVK